MSHKVDPHDLESASKPYGATPFLLYSGDDGSARVNHVSITFDSQLDDSVVVSCGNFGRGVASRVDAGATLSLLWPAPAAGEFSLIADGIGTIDDDVLRISITGAVLHRPVT